MPLSDSLKFDVINVTFKAFSSLSFAMTLKRDGLFLLNVGLTIYESSIETNCTESLPFREALTSFMRYLCDGFVIVHVKLMDSASTGK